MTISHVFIHDAIRAPCGRSGGALAGSRRGDFAALVIHVFLHDASALAPAQMDKTTSVSANAAAEDNCPVARVAGLLAGLPTAVPTTTVNRRCGSSMDAAIIGSRQIAVGECGFALRSRQTAAPVRDAGCCDHQVVPVCGADLVRSQSIRADTTLGKLGVAKPAFRKDVPAFSANRRPDVG